MADVDLTSDESAHVQNLIDTFADQMPANLHWLLPFINEHQAIPLYVGWTETTGLTVDGDIVIWSTEHEYDGLKTIDDKMLFRASLMEGVKRYPKLTSLVPARPSNAVTCDACNGTGVIAIPELSNVICRCGGVGWLDL